MMVPTHSAQSDDQPGSRLCRRLGRPVIAVTVQEVRAYLDEERRGTSNMNRQPTATTTSHFELVEASVSDWWDRVLDSHVSMMPDQRKDQPMTDHIEASEDDTVLYQVEIYTQRLGEEKAAPLTDIEVARTVCDLIDWTLVEAIDAEAGTYLVALDTDSENDLETHEHLATQALDERTSTVYFFDASMS